MDDLIASLEAATKGSRELSDRVLVAVGAYTRRKWEGDIFVWRYYDKDDYEVPADRRPDPTRDLQDAVDLVPEGKAWGVGTLRKDVLPKPIRSFAARCRREGYIGPETPEYDADASTPAIALCIAILRATGGNHGN